MYQTVGQDAIEFVARALEVPLYRRVIQGDPIEQNAEYGSRSAGGAGVLGDETEDLYTLLEHVKVRSNSNQSRRDLIITRFTTQMCKASQSVLFSQITNAFVSNMCAYWPRIIQFVLLTLNRCRRLSLTPLSYLWQRDQAELLSEMIATGIKSVLIKVAGIGLTVKHLGKTLNEMQDTFTRLVRPLLLHKQIDSFSCRTAFMVCISAVKAESTKLLLLTARCSSIVSCWMKQRSLCIQTMNLRLLRICVSNELRFILRNRLRTAAGSKFCLSWKIGSLN
jgi:hypothetical protein